MFSGCRGLTKLNLTGWNTQNVTTMGHMFSHCAKLTTLDLSSFNTEKVTFASAMFVDCSNLRTIICDDTWNFERASIMFKGCVNLKGAVSYDPARASCDMANPVTGYFTTKANAATGIATMQATADGKPLPRYNLAGQRVPENYRGVVIVGGKKVVGR